MTIQSLLRYELGCLDIVRKSKTPRALYIYWNTNKAAIIRNTMCLLRKSDNFEDCDHPDCIKFYVHLGDVQVNTVQAELINTTVISMPRIDQQNARPFSQIEMKPEIPMAPRRIQDKINELDCAKRDCMEIMNESSKYIEDEFIAGNLRIFFQEFHLKVMDELETRTRMVLQMKEMSDALEEQILGVKLELKDIKYDLSPLAPPKLDYHHRDHLAQLDEIIQQEPCQEGSIMARPSRPIPDAITGMQSILNMICGRHHQFRYSIILASKLPAKLSRGRNFRSIRVMS